MTAFAFVLYLLAFMVAGAFVRRLRPANGSTSTHPAREHVRPGEWHRPSISRLLLIAAPIFGSIAVWQAVQTRSQKDHYGDVALLWIVTMALAIVAAAMPIRRPTWARFIAWVQTYKLEIAAVSALTLAALVIRAIDLNHYTWLYSGDEGVFGTSALDVNAGRLTDPFSTGWMGHPTMWFFMQAEFMRVFGDDIAGSRLFSALLGTATIPVTYLCVRRHMGIPTALTAAALVTVFHFHIFWSRNALNNISSAFFIVLVLWLLDRVIDEWKPVDALLAGLAIGLGQFGYASNLVLIFIALIYLIYAVIAALPTTREELEEIGFKALSRGVLIGLGALLGFLPLAAYYVKYPETRDQRINQVSIFSTGWLDQERELTGQSNALTIWDQIKHVILLPWRTKPNGQYRVGPPFVGEPLFWPVLIGFVISTVCFWKRKYIGLAASYWAVVAGVALTVGPPETNRYVMASSLLPIFGAIGLVTLAGLLIRSIRLPKIIAIVAVVVAVVGIGYWNLNLYFDDSNPAERYSDENTLAADTFAYDLKAREIPYTVYYAAPPRMIWGGHPSATFIARDVTGINVDEPFTSTDSPPELTGPTVFFFLPERHDELGVVQSWFPNGELVDRTKDDGTPLFTEYFVLPGEN